MTKILVTGASGQLGSSIKIISARYDQFHFEYTDVAELDITNSSSVIDYFRESMPDYVINCAAYTAVDKAESEADLCYLLNAEAVRNLAEASAVVKARLIHISTDYVFRGSGHKPYSENDAPDPQSVYGKSKLKGEMYLMNNPDAIIIRTSWLYSQFGNNFLKTMIRYGKEKDELRVVDDQKGSPTFAPDLADAILKIISQTKEGSYKSGIYHYCNTGVTSWFGFAKKIIEKTNLPCRVIPIETKDYPTAAPRPPYSVLDSEKIVSSFEIRIPSWETSLNTCIEFLKKV